MTRKTIQKHKQRAKLSRSETGYEVGYGKPPKSSRFKKGKSGNPKGRPKGSKNRRPYLNEERLKDIIIEEAYRTIDVVEGGKTVSYPMAQAVIRALAVNAAKGQLRAQELFTSLLASTEDANNQLYAEYFDTVMSYKLNWERELEDRKLTGRIGPEPIPHPDHIVVDMKTGLVEVKGPMTNAEKRIYDKLREQKAWALEEIEELTKDLETETDPAIRKLMEDDIRRDTELVERISRVITD
ncbi:DUF5681 domain-containing protein [Hyphococcus sp. DH-69]|uniref:DUF5681 domain-containing protein n=1 Tax=Hyphococcus formosus TaxID=3143534 RepID=UPI00398A9672